MVRSQSGNPALRRKRAGSKRARSDYMADLETTNEATDPNKTRVWAWGLVDVWHAEPENVELGYTIEQFMEYIMGFNSTTYFHNLKFDGRFLLDYLLKHGYKFVQADGNRGGVERGTVTGLISDTGIFFSLTVRWRNGHSTEFRDSNRKIPLPVSRIPKAFGMEESKGDIEHDKIRPEGYEPTAKEWDYLIRDVLIPAKALKQILETGMTRLTVASDSLAEYKRLVDSRMFRRMFPVLSDHMDSEIRRAYRGGFTYADDRFRGRRVGGGLVLDVNSLYPYVMSSRPIPYDEPQWQDGEVEPTEDRPLTIFSVTFIAKIKKNHIPCIQIKGMSMFGSVEYHKIIKEPVTLMVTNVDWELYNSQYDITVLEWGGGWRFKAATGMFADYINKWSKVKAESTGGQREIAKLHLNSLYGKFATNPNVTGKVAVLKGDVVHLERGKPETRQPVYTAAGVFITSWARDLTIRAAQENYDVFAYADTDSLHLLTDVIPETLDIDPNRMGAWKHEYNFVEAYYIRPKAYVERLGIENPCPSDCVKDKRDYDHKHKFDFVVRFSGVPDKVSSRLTFDDIYEGNNLTGKLKPVAVNGGIVLKPVPYVLKDVESRV